MDEWKSKVLSFVNAPILRIFISPIVGLYYVALGVYGKSWSIFTKHELFHSRLFLFLAFATVVIVMIQAWQERKKKYQLKKDENILEAMIIFFQDLIKRKKIGF